MTAFHSANMMLDYQDIGSGPHTLVLLPGWCEPKTVFEPFIALAAERYRVISIDWRGHGLSSKASGMSLAADDLLEDVRQLLTALRLDDVITLSVAHASWLAVALAEAFPQRIRGMVFLDWIMTQPEPAFFTAVSRMQQPQQWLATRDALFDFWQGHTPRSGQTPSGGRDGAGRLPALACRRRGHRTGLPAIRLAAATPGGNERAAAVPAYLLVGSPRRLSAAAAGFAAEQPFFSVVRLGEARTHLGILERPDAVLWAVEDFWRRERRLKGPPPIKWVSTP